MDCSLPGSTAHGIFQARILEWVAISFSRGSSWPKDQVHVSCIAGRFLTVLATPKVPVSSKWCRRLCRFPIFSTHSCPWRGLRGSSHCPEGASRFRQGRDRRLETWQGTQRLQQLMQSHPCPPSRGHLHSRHGQSAATLTGHTPRPNVRPWKRQGRKGRRQNISSRYI